jgi:hypothetical protein
MLLIVANFTGIFVKLATFIKFGQFNVSICGSALLIQNPFSATGQLKILSSIWQQCRLHSYFVGPR